jgi:hypothetical protein
MSNGNIDREQAQPTTRLSSDKRPPMTTGEVLKDLMLGLIYPAVLGTIMYSGLDSLFAQRFRWSGTFDCTIILKFLLLVVTLAFYICDYLYIIFTRNYRKKFFAYDLVFLFGLYLTVRVLHLPNQEPPLKAPVIAGCYFVFMWLYYRWDRLERQAELNRRGATL